MQCSRSESYNSNNALALFCFLVSKPVFLAILPEWTSSGHDSLAGDIDFQRPKSTPCLSCRIIHLKNM